MTARSSPLSTGNPPLPQERRAEPREAAMGFLWMIDNHRSSILRCRCVDVSPSGMRLRVPSGYGIQEGQRYELTSHLPGQSSPPGLGLMVSRQAEVVRTRIIPSDDGYDMDLAVKLARPTTAAVGRSDPIRATWS